MTWVAFLLRTLTLTGQSLWRDEVDAIRFSDWPPVELIKGLFQPGHNGPLFFLLLRPWRGLTGDTEFALRYPAALLGTLTIPLGFVLARQLGLSRRAGLLLGLLLTTSPYLVWYGQEAKMYTLLLSLILLAFIAYLKALTGAGHTWWVIFVVATTLSFYTHILAPLMLIVYTGVALLYSPHLRRRWRGWLISFSCLTLPYLPLALWQAPLLLQGFESGHPFDPLLQEIFILLQLYSSGLLRFVDFSPIIYFVFLLLCGLFLTSRYPSSHSPHLSQRFILAAWAFLPPLVVYLISLRVPIFEDRYLIYITPAFYLIVVLGLTLVRQYNRLLAGLCLGLLLMINLWGIWQQQRQPIKADFRAAAAYLAQQPQPPSVIMVQMPYLQHTFHYYYPAHYTLLEGLWTNDGKTDAMVAAEMSHLTTNLTDLWLVVSEEDQWDQRHLTRAWLDQHALLLDQANFIRVDVYHYQFPPVPIGTQRLDEVESIK